MALMHKSNALGHTDHYPPRPRFSSTTPLQGYTQYIRGRHGSTSWQFGPSVAAAAAKLTTAALSRARIFLFPYINLWGTRDAIIKNQTFCSPPWPFSLAFLFLFSTPNALSTRESTHKQRVTTTTTTAVIYIIFTRAKALRVRVCVCVREGEWVGVSTYLLLYKHA